MKSLKKLMVPVTNLKIISQRFAQLRQQLPRKVGNLAVNFTKERFRAQNWLDSTPLPWKPRKANAKRNSKRAILTDTARLKRSIRITRLAELSVAYGTDVPYGKAHNEGLNTVVTVKAHRRKKFKKNKVETTQLTKKGKPRKKTVVSLVGEINVRAHPRHMRLPQRRFIGNSAALHGQIKKYVDTAVDAIFK